MNTEFDPVNSDNDYRFSPYLQKGIHKQLTTNCRGFGDSSPASQYPPTERGLVTDARTVFDYVFKHQDEGLGSTKQRIGIVGQSLGTGVSVALASQLSMEQIQISMLALVAPFTSIRELLKSYNLLHFIPILGPLAPFPQVQDFLLQFLKHNFDSVSKLSSITSPILIIHAKDDLDIKVSHSASLFDSLTQSYLSPSSKSKASVKVEVKVDDLGEFGSMKTLYQNGQTESTIGEDDSPSSTKHVVWLEAKRGGHNQVGYSDTVFTALSQMLCQP